MATAALTVALAAAGVASAQPRPPINPPSAVTFNPTGDLLATANGQTGTVSVFRVDGSGGLHEAFGSPHHTGKNPESLAFSPDGKHLAVANRSSDTVSVFSVGARGALTPVSGSPFHNAVEPSAVAWSATGLLAVTNVATSRVSVFSVSTAGRLDEVDSASLGPLPCGYPQPDCADPISASFSADGGLLAIANRGNSTVSVLSVQANGTLVPVSGSPVDLPGVPVGPTGTAPAYPDSLSFGPGGLLAVSSYNTNRVFMISVGAGGVTAMKTVDLSGNERPYVLSFGPSGLLAITNLVQNTVSVYSVGSDGDLTLVGRATTGGGPRSMAFSSTGLIAIGNQDSGSVSMFEMGADGEPTEVAGSPFDLRIPLLPFIFARVPGAPVDVSPGAPARPAFNLNSNLLAVPVYGTGVGNGRVYVLSLTPDGTVTNAPGSPFDSGSRDPYSAAFSPDGHLLAVANHDAHSVSLFRVGADGGLSDRQTFDVGPSECADGSCWRPYSVAFQPSGSQLAVASDAGEKSVVSMFQVAHGRLEREVSTSFACSYPRTPYNNVAFNANGTLIAASCYSGPDAPAGAVWTFQVNSDGNLTPGPNSPFPTGEGTMSLGFSADGRLLAVPSDDENSVWLLSVDNAGRLTKVSEEPTGQGPWGAAFSPSDGPFGELLGTADYNSATVSLFSVGAARRHVRRAADRGSRQRRPAARRATSPLTPLAGSPILTDPVEPDSLTFSPNGHFLATGDTYEFQGFSLWAPTGPLQIRKKAVPTVVTQGGVLRFRLTVHNPGRHPVTATVTDDLADLFDHGTYRHDVTATIPTATVNTARRQLTWHGNLGAGKTVTIRYSFRIDAHASGIVANRVLGPPSASCGPPAPELPCETETPIVPPPGPGADLSVTKTASTHTTHPGDQVLYTLLVRNHGPLTATRVTLEDPLPPGLLFHTAKPSQGSCDITATGLTCRLGRIRSGGSAEVLVEAAVGTNASGTITNVANVHGRQHDPHPANNTDSERITVAPWPEGGHAAPGQPGREHTANLVVDKHAPRTVTHGHRFHYRITVTNRGPDSAADVMLIDDARLPFTVVSIHTSQGRCNTGLPIRCALGTLHNGAHATITVTARATHAGRQANTAVVMSPSWDPGPGGNMAEAKTTIRHRAKRRPPPPAPATTLYRLVSPALITGSRPGCAALTVGPPPGSRPDAALMRQRRSARSRRRGEPGAVTSSRRRRG